MPTFLALKEFKITYEQFHSTRRNLQMVLQSQMPNYKLDLYCFVCFRVILCFFLQFTLTHAM
ncbi:hypothetical protein PAHAL_5G295000 [Panicum hallii]|jgi:hypothetical protein|uniref:Uncharacterized protein n=1 Tax=Panicum hallii TaxID=206008 RepID=A0A2T8ILN1_9POAL|nr:hypothetical protein PAHAL_5G295000 [Panicum hallii]